MKYFVRSACNTSEIPAKVEASSVETNLATLSNILNQMYSGSESVAGIEITPASVHTLDKVYFQLDHGKPATFIDSDVKTVLEYCGFDVYTKGIGYAVDPD